MSKRGKPCGGRPWDKANLRALVTNPVYLGLVRHKGEMLPGEHEAIIDRETWDAAQALITRDRRKHAPSVRNKHGALLRGLLFCGSCGVAMHHHYAKKRNRLYRYYVCHHALKRGWSTCPTKSVPADEIEKFVVEQIRAIGQDPALAAEVATRARAAAEADQKALRDEERALRKTLRQAGRQVAECVGGADAPRRLADLQDRIHAGQHRLDEIAAALAATAPEITAESVTAALAGFDGVWDGLPTPERCRLLSLLIERITYDGETITVSYRPNGLFDTPR